jgi:muconolactone delta-isomerase
VRRIAAQGRTVDPQGLYRTGSRGREHLLPLQLARLGVRPAAATGTTSARLGRVAFPGPPDGALFQTQEALSMEYLVTMTTHVPDGTPEQEVNDIRAREAARSAELAAQGHLLRLFRPPLKPGEWRTLGLFAADDADRLEEVLASMPLRVWRTDDVTLLSPHPNDPGRRTGSRQATEFLTTFTIAVPEGTPDQAVRDTEAREAERAHELAEQGHLERLWVLGPGRALGLWQAPGPAEMQAILKSLPLDSWMSVETTPLTEHPSDPARAGA